MTPERAELINKRKRIAGCVGIASSEAPLHLQRSRGVGRIGNYTCSSERSFALSP